MGGSIKKCKQESGLAWSSKCPYFISFLSITAAGTLNPSLAVSGQNRESKQPVSFPPSWFFYPWDLDAGREAKDSKQRKRQRGFGMYPQIQSLPGTALLEYKHHHSVDSSGF